MPIPPLPVFHQGGAASGVGGSGDVVGPASSTDNALARFDATTGKLLQDGVVTESDSGAIAGVTQLDVDNLRVDGNTISSTNANGNINLTPNGTGIVVSAPSVKAGQGLYGSAIWLNPNSDTSPSTANLIIGSSGFWLGSGAVFGWSASASNFGATADTGISRAGAADFAFGNGTAGNAVGTLKFGGARCRGFTTTAAAATTTEYPTDKDWGIHLNSNTGAVHLIFNNAGAIKSVQLT